MKRRPPTMFVSIPHGPEERILGFIERMERRVANAQYANDSELTEELSGYIEVAKQRLEWGREFHARIAAKRADKGAG